MPIWFAGDGDDVEGERLKRVSDMKIIVKYLIIKIKVLLEYINNIMGFTVLVKVTQLYDNNKLKYKPLLKRASTTLVR